MTHLEARQVADALGNRIQTAATEIPERQTQNSKKRTKSPGHSSDTPCYAWLTTTMSCLRQASPISALPRVTLS